MAGEAGIDPTVQAFCGWCSITGPDHGRGEMFRHLAHLDLTTATTITQAVLQGLIARERTGTGPAHRNRDADARRWRSRPRGWRNILPPESSRSRSAARRRRRCPIRRSNARTAGISRSGSSSDEQWPGFCRALKLDQLIADAALRERIPMRVHASRRLIPILARALRDEAGDVVDDPAHEGEGAQRHRF